MNSVRIGRNVAQVYSGVTNEIPAGNYFAFQRYAIMDSRLGSSVLDFDRHFAELNEYYKREEEDKIDQKIKNIRVALHLTLEKTNPKMLSFIPLIYSWNGKKIDTRTDEAVKKWSDKIQYDISVGQLTRLLDQFKKKLKSISKTIFRRFTTHPNQDSYSRNYKD